ncbi:glycosyltransferase family 4 protein [Pseudoalteromonas sp. T1lg24]|uniref:glycosyltransferase family 4 protein n=1 Tax=Pseudoalteromonas sp. T1lg24 TaxID=2077099 RepID=UPI000CF614B2|nr:glycosyltransferase [Pseudoalteromonas sp. T1lg24]
MENNKIVIVCSDPVYPATGGAAARLLQMVTYLRNTGFIVDLITKDHDCYDSGLFEVFDKVYIFNKRGFFTSIKNVFDRFLKICKVNNKKSTDIALKKKLYQKKDKSSFIIRKIDHDFNYYCGQVNKVNNYHSVISIYAWNSSALRYFENAFKFIDTIDIQHKRTALANEAGYNLKYRECTIEEERDELNLADVIIAIQNEEHKQISEMCPEKPVITVQHALPIVASQQKSFNKSILCVGNSYDPNIKGIINFITKVLPKVKEVHHDAYLTVCGTVCRDLQGYEDTPGVRLLGFVDDLSKEYENADIVVNPVPYGTGLKIKSVEALCFGKCLVATPAGVYAIDGEQSYIKSDIESMADEIINLFNVPSRIDELSLKASIFAKQNYGVDAVFGKLAQELTQKSEYVKKKLDLEKRQMSLSDNFNLKVLETYFTKFREKGFWCQSDNNLLMSGKNKACLYLLDTNKFDYEHFYNMVEYPEGRALAYGEYSSPNILWELRLNDVYKNVYRFDIHLFETQDNPNSGLITLREPGTPFGFWFKRRDKDGKLTITVRDCKGVSKGMSWSDNVFDSWKHISFIISDKSIVISSYDKEVLELDLTELIMPKDITRVELGHIPGGDNYFSGMVSRLEVTKI